MWLLALACAAPPEPAPPPAAARIDGVPFVRQRPDFCGEACLAMASGVDQDAVFALTGVDPLLGRGAYASELVVAARALGYDPGPSWFPAHTAEAQFAAMVDDLRAGVPSVVCMRFDAAPDAPEHFRLVTGYDPAADEVRFHDPAVGADQRLSRADFLALWPLADAPQIVRLRLAGTPRPPAVAPGLTGADLAQAVRTARLLAGDDVPIAVEPPWVIVGDDAQVVQARRATVAWTTRQLRANFFAKDPDEVWTIWLFSDDDSYTRNAWALFGHTPSTPYGYANSEHHALIMNIGTGGGTLVHEMVHPYIDANLPGAPTWINEGLASLYEHVRERDGHIWGDTNWRLEGLQAAILARDLPGVRWLTLATPEQFYGEGSGDHYAVARYLMQYLQEQGKLRAFLAAYAARRAQDPSGYQTLLDTLGETDEGAFTARFERWAMALQR